MCLAQLRYLIDQNPEKNCRGLLSYFENEISKWPSAKIVRSHEADPLSEVLNQFKNNECNPLIEKARYASLMWKMRNSAVHEFRRPGMGFPMSEDDSTPYYHQMSYNNKQSTRELFIPAEVISSLVKKSATRLRTVCETLGKNPYDSFDWGSSWFSD